MTRFLGVAAVALALSFVSAGKADAQIVYGYSVPGGGGIMSGRSVVAPGAYQTYNSYYSPFTGVVQKQAYYTDVFGQSYGRSFGYNPWTGTGYNYGYYQPNYLFAPGLGYSYGYARRW